MCSTWVTLAKCLVTFLIYRVKIIIVPTSPWLQVASRQKVGSGEGCPDQEVSVGPDRQQAGPVVYGRGSGSRWS